MRKRPRRKGLHLYFSPHAHNDYHPHLLSLFSVLVIVASAIALPFVLNKGVEFALESRGQSAAVVSSSLYQLANADRGVHGREHLMFNATLSYAAQLKAEDMARRQYFSHNDPEGNEPWIWFDKVGYVYDNAGENLAIDFQESRDVQIAWMNSEKHRENILKKEYTEIGIGTAEGVYQGRPTTYVVQFFGKPKTIAVALSPQVKSVPAQKPAASSSRAAAEEESASSSNGTLALESADEGVVLGTGTQAIYADDELLVGAQELPREYLSGWLGRVMLLLGSPSYLLLGIYGALLLLFLVIAVQLFGKHHLFIRREAYIGAVLVIIVVAVLLVLSYTPAAVQLA